MGPDFEYFGGQAARARAAARAAATEEERLHHERIAKLNADRATLALEEPRAGGILAALRRIKLD
jgi:hypothetical protein